MNDTITVVEIWMPREKGEVIVRGKGAYKIVAKLVGGYPIFLEEGFMSGRVEVSKEQAKQMIINSK